MPKVNELMSTEQFRLYYNLQTLVNRANQRIRRIENVTGVKEGFAIKQLADFLSSSPVQGFTKKGRIRLNKSMTMTQLIAISTAVNNFLENDYSKIKNIRELRQKYSDEIKDFTGKDISFKQANVLYQSGKNYTWIYDYIPKSTFWGSVVKEVNKNNWSQSTFIDRLSTLIDKELDEELKTDLIALYQYVKE